MNRELQRLAAVKRFMELDLDAAITRDLNDIVALAAQICNAPIAAITLVDTDMQWLKVHIGTELTHTAREASFCNETIKQDSVMVIPDALADELHCNNPFVTQDPFIRFYAGATLTTKDDHSIGSLCVLDHVPGQLNEQQQNTLKVLSRQVVNLMELSWSLQVLAHQNERSRKHEEELENSALKLKAIFDSSTDLHMLLGKNLEILGFNKSADDYVYSIYEKQLATGQSMLEYIDPKIKNQMVKYFAIAFSGRAIKHEWLLRAGTPQESWREIKLVPIKNNAGKIIGVALNSTDISKRKQQERQITIQNEALTRIAIIQSHELRRPVASLLGLMNLIKLEEIDFSYLNMMEITVNELDEKIRIIIEDSEKTINSHLSIVA